jgi:ketosteroid isomerase-like protein
MKTGLAFAPLFAAILLSQDPTEAVREAALGWTGAAVKQDKAALERWLADDLTYSHANGRTETKSDYIAAVTGGPPRYESFDFSDLRIRIYGGVAVLTGFVDVKMVRAEPFRVRTLQVYALSDGRWRMSAHQSARIGR